METKININWESPESIVGEAQNLAENMNVSKTQIRKLFNALRRIEMETRKKGEFPEEKIHFLKPKLAYQIAREDELKKLEPYFMNGIEYILKKEKDKEKKKAFEKLLRFMEAVVAYTEKKESETKGGKR